MMKNNFHLDDKNNGKLILWTRRLWLRYKIWSLRYSISTFKKFKVVSEYENGLKFVWKGKFCTLFLLNIMNEVVKFSFQTNFKLFRTRISGIRKLSQTLKKSFFKYRNDQKFSRWLIRPENPLFFLRIFRFFIILIQIRKLSFFCQMIWPVTVETENQVPFLITATRSLIFTETKLRSILEAKRSLFKISSDFWRDVKTKVSQIKYYETFFKRLRIGKLLGGQTIRPINPELFWWSKIEVLIEPLAESWLISVSRNDWKHHNLTLEIIGCDTKQSFFQMKIFYCFKSE